MDLPVVPNEKEILSTFAKTLGQEKKNGAEVLQQKRT